MEHKKWYVSVLRILLVVVFSPLIIISLLIAGIATLFSIPTARKEYLRSRYYHDFHPKFRLGIISSPAYIFYNSAMRRRLPIQFMRQEASGSEYFIYQDTLFLFPNFDYMFLNDDKTRWQVYDDSYTNSFEEQYKLLVSSLEADCDLPVKVLVERGNISEPDLRNIKLPDEIFVTWGYEEAFENEDSPLKLIIPQNNSELYDMMAKTPDLCGEFKLEESFIHWHLNDKITVNIGVDPRDCYIGVAKKVCNIEYTITHWHPEMSEIYKDICKIGIKGSVLVIRSFLGEDSVLYYGPEENCPYPQKKKYLIGKYYYIVP